MLVELAAPTLFRGAQRVPVDGLATTPLGYDRDALSAGEPLQGIKAGELKAALDHCDEVVFSFDGKLGDTLLAFGAIAAILDYLTLGRQARLPIVRALGPYAALFNQAGLLDSFDVREVVPAPQTARTVLVGDRQGVGLSVEGKAGRVLATFTCDPETPPCWASGRFAYPALPARYFLSVERELGIRLGSNEFMPLLGSATPPSAGEAGKLRVGIVTATSWPARKDYGLPQFLEATALLAGMQGVKIEALVIPGREAGPIRDTRPAPDDVIVEILQDAHFSLIGGRLSACDLVIGNDTGLVHLAAATRASDGSGPQVLGLHARHSHAKWRTGLTWHHALATAFSETMHRNDLCPVRDKIDDRAFGAASDIGAIAPACLADIASELLDAPAETDG